jgi:primosomal protein N'
MAEETLAPLGACINLMLPPGLSQRTDTLVQLNPERQFDEETFAPLEKRIVHLLQDRGALRGRQLNASLRHVEWRGAVRKLARAGIVQTRAVLPPTRVRPKTVRKVALAIPPDQIETLPDPLSRVEKVHERRLRVLRFLAGEAGLVEPSWVYAQTGANNGDLKMLA